MSFLDNSKIAERLSRIRGDVSMRKFAMAADIDPSQYTKIEKGELTISENILQKLIDKYNVDKDYILYGTMIPHNKFQSYIEKRRVQKNSSENPGIPVYEAAPTTLTNTEVYRDEKIGTPDFWISIPNLRDCDYGTRAKGDSMHPLIRTNALIIGKRIVDFNVIIMGEIYTVRTKNGMETTKYIHPHPDNDELILLVPYNEKAKTTVLHKSDIAEIYEAKAVFNNL